MKARAAATGREIRLIQSRNDLIACAPVPVSTGTGAQLSATALRPVCQDRVAKLAGAAHDNGETANLNVSLWRPFPAYHLTAPASSVLRC